MPASPRTARVLLSVAAATLGFWLCLASLFAIVVPPRAAPLTWPALIVTLAFSALMRNAWRRPWFRSALGNCAAALVAATAVIGVVATVFFGPFFPVFPAFIVLAMISAGVVVAALARVRRRQWDTMAALALVGVFCFLLTLDGGRLEQTGLRVRLNLVEAHWRRAGDRVVRSPAQPTGTSDRPFKANNEFGPGSVAGWRLIDGILSSGGLVYDPNGVLASGGSVRSAGYYSLSSTADWCDHIEGPWYACRLE